MKTYITKAKNGHYTVTAKSNGDVFKFKYIQTLELARQLVPLAISNVGKPIKEVKSLGYSWAII